MNETVKKKLEAFTKTTELKSFDFSQLEKAMTKQVPETKDYYTEWSIEWGVTRQAVKQACLAHQYGLAPAKDAHDLKWRVKESLKLSGYKIL